MEVQTLKDPNAAGHLFGLMLVVPVAIVVYTFKLLKVLVPIWSKRIAAGFKQDSRIAWYIFTGRNVVILENQEPVEVNKYHRRYDGTDREAA